MAGVAPTATARAEPALFSTELPPLRRSGDTRAHPDPVALLESVASALSAATVFEWAGLFDLSLSSEAARRRARPRRRCPSTGGIGRRCKSPSPTEQLTAPRTATVAPWLIEPAGPTPDPNRPLRHRYTSDPARSPASRSFCLLG